MKCLTLNTHSWHETNQLEKISQLADYINQQQFDIIALQEVNQSMSEPQLDISALIESRYYATDSNITIRQNNFAYVLLQQLSADYYWTWVPTHQTRHTYDEGLAILSRTPIVQASYDFVSQLQDYNNYRTRRLLIVQTEVNGQSVWIADGHYGWWHDEEHFRGQWDRTEQLLSPHQNQLILMLGDLNNVAEIRDEGYDYVMSKGWFDTYTLAKVKDDGHTVVKAIAGWENNATSLRIDYILANRPLAVHSSAVALNGVNGAIVSDHLGVAVELDLE